MSILSYLEVLIDNFLREFEEIYLERSLTPKMHYLMHAWCMRYEAKHKYFKGIANVIGNFKNVEKTVAFRHQRSITK